MSGSDLVTGTLDLVILKTLLHGPMHGYAIGRTIREGSAEVLSVGEGVLYPALHRLERRKFLTAEWGKTDTGREAKFYTITRAGHRWFEKRSDEWMQTSSAVAAILAERKA